MIARGAKGTDEEFAAVLDYLSKNFLGDAPRPLNINRANNIELESVAGLTRTEAAALLKWRQAAGFCKSLEDLKKVPGIDYKKIEARKDFLVCFEAVPAPPPVKKQEN
jgi:competence protein ComEA